MKSMAAEIPSLQGFRLVPVEAEIRGTDHPAQRPVGLPFVSIAGHISDNGRTPASVILAELQAPHVSPPHKSGGETWGDPGWKTIGVLLFVLILAALFRDQRDKEISRVLARARQALAPPKDDVQTPEPTPWANWVELRADGSIVLNGEAFSSSAGFAEVKITDKRGATRAVVSSAGGGMVRIVSHGRTWLLTAPPMGRDQWEVFRGGVV